MTHLLIIERDKLLSQSIDMLRIGIIPKKELDRLEKINMQIDFVLCAFDKIKERIDLYPQVYSTLLMVIEGCQ